MRKTFSFFFVCLALVITATHLLNSLEKKEKHLGDRLPRALVAKCYGEDGGEDCLKGTEMTSEKKDHLLSQTVRNYVGGME